MKTINNNKSLNDIISIKKEIKNLNKNFKKNTLKNIKDKNSPSTKDKYFRAFSTKNGKNKDRIIFKNYIKTKKIIQNKKKFLKIKINDNEGQYYSTSDLVKSSRDNKYQSYISPKIGDDLVYFNVNMNWINTKGHDFKKMTK